MPSAGVAEGSPQVQDILDALGSFLEPAEPEPSSPAYGGGAPDTATWVSEHRDGSRVGTPAGTPLDADAAFEKGIALYEQGYDDEQVRVPYASCLCTFRPACFERCCAAHQGFCGLPPPGWSSWAGGALRHGARVQTMREAWLWLTAAARQNHGPACCALGDIALEGTCAACASAADAVRWYAQASALGAHPVVRQPAHQAAELFLVRFTTAQPAAGDLTAMLKHAACLELGRGVERDEGAALLIYERAAAHGSAVAQNNIGQMILDGRGVAEDAAFAAKWFRRAPCPLWLPFAPRLRARCAFAHAVRRSRTSARAGTRHSLAASRR